jgi:lysophospholipase L1-like esterase
MPLTRKHLLLSLPVLLAWAWAGAAGGFAGERLSNGSFENTLINGLPADWELYCPPAPAGTHEQWTRAAAAYFATDTGASHEGGKSIRISADTPTRCAILQRSIPARAGDQWRLSFWMKGRSLKMKPEPGATVRLSFLNSTDRDKNASLAPLSRAFPCLESDFDWREFAAQGEVPEGADVLQLELFLVKSSGTVWFDDISLDIASPAAASPAPEIPTVDRSGSLHYKNVNAALASQPKTGPRVVFMGDSITEGWSLGTSFPGEGFINRGIGGQQTWQMAARFPADALDLKPDLVVFLGGTNDIGGNVAHDVILANIQAMIRVCRENKVRLIVSPVLPVSNYNPAYQRAQRRPPEKILEFNAALRTLCHAEGARYLDLHSALVDEAGFLGAHLSRDGLHLNADGYKIISPLVQKAIREELGKPPL